MFQQNKFPPFSEKPSPSFDTKINPDVLKKPFSPDENEMDIFCRRCEFLITSKKNQIPIHGRHIHIFQNPSGIVYEIGCFGNAQGIVVQGIPTLEFTWFPSFAWSYALCLNCNSLLGWHYVGEGEFFGLILAYLK